MAGRKPKPTEVKKLEGNPGKRKLNTKEPIPAKGMPNCPEWLLPEAKEEYSTSKKVKRLLDYTDEPRDISDPWYSGKFDITYQDIKEGCEAFLKTICPLS